MSYTRIPNEIIDNLKLNPYQFQIFSIIVRKTDGWCKVEDGISLSQFEKLVTFSKNTIIKTIKELQELNLIEVVAHFDSVKKIHSYNTYKVSQGVVHEMNNGSSRDEQGVVHEMNNGSSRDEQGVVHEMNKQKKTITKETNTNKENKLFLSYKNENPNASENELKIVEDFILYRKQIKDELKTLLPIKSYLKALMELHKLGYKVKDCILKMKENEWKTIKVDYIHKEDKKTLNADSAYGGYNA